MLFLRRVVRVASIIFISHSLFVVVLVLFLCNACVDCQSAQPTTVVVMFWLVVSTQSAVSTAATAQAAIKPNLLTMATPFVLISMVLV